MISEYFVIYEQIGPEQIEALYQYAKFQFECGNYSGAADFLYQYRALCTDSDRNLSAIWGKLAAEILMQNWDVALEELNRLREIIDAKVHNKSLLHTYTFFSSPSLWISDNVLFFVVQNFGSPLTQLQSRIWLMHWSLFIFFNHDSGRNGIIDLFLYDRSIISLTLLLFDQNHNLVKFNDKLKIFRYLNAIQTNAPHLMRYLATALIINKKKRIQLKEFIKVIQQDQYSYKDPITEFLQCLYVNYDFDGAQQKLRECEDVSK